MLASDGTDFFIAWADRRAFVYSHVYGARISRDGVVLDPAALQISHGYQEVPEAAAFDGTNYFVVWRRALDPASPDPELYGARITPAGRLLDPDPIRLGAAPDYPGSASLASDGRGTLLLTWSTPGISPTGSTHAVLAERISGDRVLDPAPVDVAGGLALGVRTAATFGGSDFGTGRFLVAFSRATDSCLCVRRLTSDGRLEPVSRLGLCGRPNSGRVAVGWNGAGYLSVRSDIFFNVDALYLPRSSTVANARELYPYGQSVSVASAAGRFLLADIDQGALQVRHVDGTGARIGMRTVVDTGTTATQRYEIPPLTSNGTTYLTARASNPRNLPRSPVVAWRIAPDARVLDPNGIEVGNVANAQTSPVVGCSQGQYLVVWQDARGPLRDGVFGTTLYGARLDADGARINPAGFRIGAAAPSAARAFRISSGAQGFLVGWTDAAGLRAARIGSNGQVLDPGGIASSTTPVGSFSSFFDGQRHQLLWFEGSDASPVLRRTLVAEDGATAPRTDALNAPAAIGWPPSAASNGRTPILVWSAPDGMDRWDVFATRLADVATAQPVRVATGALDPKELSIVSDGDGYLVLFLQEGRISGVRLSADGALLDRTPLTLASPHSPTGRLSAVFDGGAYVVRWAHYPEGQERRVVFIRVSRSGTVLTPDPIEIGLGFGDIQTGRSILAAPSAGSCGGRRALVPYHILDPAQGYVSLRAKARLITSDPEDDTPRDGGARDLGLAADASDAGAPGDAVEPPTRDGSPPAGAEDAGARGDAGAGIHGPTSGCGCSSASRDPAAGRRARHRPLAEAIMLAALLIARRGTIKTQAR